LMKVGVIQKKKKERGGTDEIKRGGYESVSVG